MSVKCLPPQTPLLYSKTGIYRGTPIFFFFFLFLLKNIDCGYSLEPPQRGGTNAMLIFDRSPRHLVLYICI